MRLSKFICNKKKINGLVQGNIIEYSNGRIESRYTCINNLVHGYWVDYGHWGLWEENLDKISCITLYKMDVILKMRDININGYYYK